MDYFVKKLAETLDPERNDLSVINGGDYVSSAGDKAKEELDNTLKETLQNGHFSEQSTPDNFNPRPRA